jgi:hypothetical protein
MLDPYLYQINMDPKPCLVGPLPVSSAGFNYIFSMIDRYQVAGSSTSQGHLSHVMCRQLRGNVGVQILRARMLHLRLWTTVHLSSVVHPLCQARHLSQPYNNLPPTK